MSVLTEAGVWRYWKIVCVVLVSVYLSGATGSAMAGSSDPLTRFSHGVNLSHWFAQSVNGYDPAHLAHFVSDADLKAIKAAGLDHVRLSVAPGVLFTAGRTNEFNVQVLNSLMSALDRIQAEGLSVVLDLHPVGSEKASLLTEPTENVLVVEWAAIAQQLADQSPDTLAFEVLNEPDPAKGENWWSLQGRVLASIRNVDKHRIVIVNGGGWSGIDDLITNQPYDDPHVVYTIHYYAPILFTHQGANWSWNIAERIAALGWPQAREQADIAAGAATHDQEAEGFVRDQITSGQFTSHWMDEQFDRLTEWQKKYHAVSIYVGEFGVYAKNSPSDARLRWISAVREGCEKRGWGWALWDNSVSFGFADVRDGKQVIDISMLRSLGMVR